MSCFRIGILTLVFLAAWFAGCGTTEPQVVRVRGGFQKIPGATGGLYRGVDQPQSNWVEMMEELSEEDRAREGSVTDPVAAMRLEASLRRVNDDQSITLISRAPRHVIFHLLQTLRAGEYELLEGQVLSEHTKRSMIEAGRDPAEAVDYLRSNQLEIEEFLAVIPFGEQTPGMIQQSIGRNMFRLQVDQARLLGLKFDSLDVIIEDQSYRLLNVH